jgi:hypothetical protein
MAQAESLACQFYHLHAQWASFSARFGETGMPICEGCGTRADNIHIQRRADRLDLAQRYRPASIRVLFLDAAPPGRDEDYFYRSAKDRASRSLASRMHFDQLIKTVGLAPGSDIVEDKALADFQKRGFYLAYCVECPFEEVDDSSTAVRRFAPTLIKRLQHDLQPSYVVPISKPVEELVRLVGLIGWGDRLVLDNGGPFVDPYFGDPQRQASFGTAFGDRISKLLAALP